MDKENYKAFLFKKGYARNTVKGYVRVAEKLKDWVKLKRLPISKVDDNDLLDFKDFLVTHYDQKEQGARNNTKSLKHYFHFLGFKVNPAGLLDFSKREEKVLEGMMGEWELIEIYRSAEAQTMVQKRDKAILGLIIFTAIKREELSLLELTDVDLEAKQINVPGTKVTNPRIIELDTNQYIDLAHYILEVREELLMDSEKPNSPYLFFSQGSGNNISNVLNRFMPRIQRKFPQVKGTGHLRRSRISIWANSMDLATTQYLSGFKYLSSLEIYEKKDLEKLKDKVRKFHPLSGT